MKSDISSTLNPIKLSFAFGSVLFICTCRFHLSCLWLCAVFLLAFGCWYYGNLLFLPLPALQGPPGSQPSPHTQLPPSSNMMGAHGQVTAHISMYMFSLFIRMYLHTSWYAFPKKVFLPPLSLQLLYWLHAVKNVFLTICYCMFPYPALYVSSLCWRTSATHQNG